MKNALGYDDSLDVFGVHCVGGILGALATGILVNPCARRRRHPDYVTNPASSRSRPTSIGAGDDPRSRPCCMTLCWSGVGSAILYKIVDMVVGLRVTEEEEREGLDLADHGERAYNY